MENLIQEIESVKVGEIREPMVNVMISVSMFQKIIECSTKWSESPSEWLTKCLKAQIKSDTADSPELCLPFYQ
jgi:hypothetical protein